MDTVAAHRTRQPARRGGHRPLPLTAGALAGAEKEALANRWRVVFIDESGFYLLPAAKRTYAPRGQTPILRASCRYEHLSVMAAVTMESQLFTRVRSRSLNSFDSAVFLKHPRVHLPGGKLLVIWNRSPIHRFKAIQAFQASAFAAEHFVFKVLPAYAPDLNPLDIGVWHRQERRSGQGVQPWPGGTTREFQRRHCRTAPQTSPHPSSLCRSETVSWVITSQCNAQ